MEEVQFIDCQYLDTFLVFRYCLVAYTNFIAFGSTIFYNEDIAFESKSYLKIYPDHYQNWLNAILNIKKYFCEEDIENERENESEKNLICAQLNATIFWKKGKNCVTFTLSILKKDVLNLQCDFFEIIKLEEGIFNLAFFPFCISIDLAKCVHKVFSKLPCLKAEEITKSQLEKLICEDSFLDHPEKAFVKKIIHFYVKYKHYIAILKQFVK